MFTQRTDADMFALYTCDLAQKTPYLEECVAATHWLSLLSKYSIVRQLSTCGVRNDTKDSHWLVDEPMICLKTCFSFSPQFDSTVHVFLA
jgi:hypothetical protein